MVDPVTETAPINSSERTRIRRLPEKTVGDRAVLDAILDEGLVAHVGIVDDGQPFVLPVGYARRGDQVIVHGSSGSRLFRTLAAGAPACLSVTLLDGLVYARSAFESSMNYRSAMILGSAIRLTGDDELDALHVLSDHLLPGRWEHARQPSRKELAATLTVAMPIDEWSVKVGAGGPGDLESDLRDEPWRSIWAGHVPISQVMHDPISDEHVPEGVPVPSYVAKRASR
jgi:nitroimidazol reductase NimA-like FMN-containing flavoprotein (pyridoxamine 5'-phosphate oxidase superfamily)